MVIFAFIWRHSANMAMDFRAALALFLLALFRFATAAVNRSHVSALQAMKRKLEPSSVLKSWKGNDPCTGNWEGIICDDSKLHVTEIHLLQKNFTGTLAPEIGDLSNLQVLDLMWNNISGTIPASLGNLQNLTLLLLNGNNLTGPLPPELGNLKNLNRLQIDENNIGGVIPPSFGNMTSMKHLHMNNNSLSGDIPPELGRLPKLLHMLIDNNKLTGKLPKEISISKSLQILQLDNNFFEGSQIPPSYSELHNMTKISLRHCNLTGSILNFTRASSLEYIDLSNNRLAGHVPRGHMPNNLTTIKLSHNFLTGKINGTFTEMTKLQTLELENNRFRGSIIPSQIIGNKHDDNEQLLDFRNNLLSAVILDASFQLPNSTSLWLYGNPLCNTTDTNVTKFCSLVNTTREANKVNNVQNLTQECSKDTCNPVTSELVPGECRCASPIKITCRLKSPSFTNFNKTYYENFMNLGLNLSKQLYVDSYTWESGPRLRLILKIFPSNITTSGFNRTEVLRIFLAFANWKIRDNLLFGPREFIKLDPPYGIDIFQSTRQNKRVLGIKTIVAILFGAMISTILLVSSMFFVIYKFYAPSSSLIQISRGNYNSMNMRNIKQFSLTELKSATNSFCHSSQVGEGGYGNVYKGVLTNGQVVAIKRARMDSQQGKTQFFREIELLTRVHHVNLVSLVGFCTEGGEQMLVYEFMTGGTLRDHLQPRSKSILNFRERVSIALGTAKGIMYLHTEANPPIFHRDIKSSNILLDDKNNPKVSDFGLSKNIPESGLEIIRTISSISTVLKGTPGYLDPEYMLTQKYTDKSDLYSFGVVLLELLTGLEAIYGTKNIVREVKSAYEAGSVYSMVDARMGSYEPKALEKMLALALNCCDDTAEKRPSITSVVLQLENIDAMAQDFTYEDTYEHLQDEIWLLGKSTSANASNTFISGPIIMAR